MNKSKLIFIFTILSSLTTVAEQYTCPTISRATEEVKWNCLEQASDKLRFKAQMMSQKLLEQVKKIETQLDEKQDVFIIARAGSSLAGFDHLRNTDEIGNTIGLEDVFDYGLNKMPNKSVDRVKYNQWLAVNSDKVRYRNKSYDDVITEVRQSISKKFLDKSYSKLTFSHAGILFRTAEGVWNIYHELTPCNEEGKAYLFQDSTISGTSSFFVDKPHKYTGLVLPIKKSLQKRILHTIANKQEFLARGPVYIAMSNPWDADSGNSNSFILEMIELGLTSKEVYNSMVTEYEKGRDEYLKFMADKKAELGVELLSLKQKENIEVNDPGYKKVCRPDYNIRKELVKNYTEKGYKPALVVFDSSVNGAKGFKDFFKHTFEQIKVKFIPVVGEHIRPSRKFYKEHMKLGVGESISVKSIWDYLENQNLINKKVDPSLFIIPELNGDDSERLQAIIEANIFLYSPDDQQESDINKLDAIIKKMNQ